CIAHCHATLARQLECRILIQVKEIGRRARHIQIVDEAHIEQMMAVMTACHGADAETAARKRANRCLRRKEPEWSTLWREVADRLARGEHNSPTHGNAVEG